MSVGRSAMSVRRSAASFGVATVLGHLSQLVWLAAGVRVMSRAEFGTVLAAQTLYGVLQTVIDIGTNGVGARAVARGELDDERRGQIMRSHGCGCRHARRGRGEMGLGEVDSDTTSVEQVASAGALALGAEAE